MPGQALSIRFSFGMSPARISGIGSNSSRPSSPHCHTWTFLGLQGAEICSQEKYPSLSPPIIPISVSYLGLLPDAEARGRNVGLFALVSMSDVKHLYVPLKTLWQNVLKEHGIDKGN